MDPNDTPQTPDTPDTPATPDEQPEAKTAQLYSTVEGKVVDYQLSVDKNGDIIAEYGDDFLKFPGNVTKEELQGLFDAHNEANDGIVGLTPEEVAKQESAVANANSLLDEL